jgi:hypothetical protein
VLDVGGTLHECKAQGRGGAPAHNEDEAKYESASVVCNGRRRRRRWKRRRWREICGCQRHGNVAARAVPCRDGRRAILVACVSITVIGLEEVAICAVGDSRERRVRNGALVIVKMLNDPEVGAVGLQLAVHSFGRPSMRVQDEALVIVDCQNVWRMLYLVARQRIEATRRHERNGKQRKSVSARADAIADAGAP